jgi:hypothetical protein
MALDWNFRVQGSGFRLREYVYGGQVGVQVGRSMFDVGCSYSFVPAHRSRIREGGWFVSVDAKKLLTLNV